MSTSIAQRLVTLPANGIRGADFITHAGKMCQIRSLCA